MSPHQGALSNATAQPVMSTPLLRLFAVFWWLLVIVSATSAVFCGLLGRGEYVAEQVSLEGYDRRHQLPPGTAVPRAESDDAFWQRQGFAPVISSTGPLQGPPADPTPYILWGGAAAVACLVLPFSVLTVIRWTVTGRWRVGPRW
jgi:hypothetical protein